MSRQTSPRVIILNTHQMKFILFKRTVLISVLFASSFFISCHALNILDMEPGNIHGIYSEVTLAGDQLHLHNNLTRRADSAPYLLLRFYLPSDRILRNLEISNEQGEKMKYSLSCEGDNTMIEVVIDAETQNFIVDYDVDLSKMKTSITFQRDKNQLFILPETSLFPKNQNELTPDNIVYTVTVSGSAGLYSYAKQTTTIKASIPPTIIFGNFRIVELDGVKVYMPRDINVNKEALDYVASCIVSAFNYYTKIYGESILSEDIKLFFLNRRGGYTFQDGIILNQKYISTDTVARNDLVKLISHEIAHLWWGIGVKTRSWSIAEGLAELSSDLYLIENVNNNSKSIYSHKNAIVLDSNMKPQDIENLNIFNTNYRAIAYNKLPIIFHEAELKIGREKLVNALSSFYIEKKKSSKLSGFDEIINHFPAAYQTELRKDVDGTLENWPDYYINSVSGNTVVFRGDNINFPETVPVELTTDQNEVISDTLHFDTATNEIVKQYHNNIVKIVIDSDFITNQSVLLNDLWTKDSKSLLDNKWLHAYPPKYHTFFNSLLNYLFTDKDVRIDDIIDRNIKSSLSVAKKKLMNIDIYGAFLKIRVSNQYFKITVTFNTKEGFENGFIEGHFYEKENTLYLKSIERIKI